MDHPSKFNTVEWFFGYGGNHLGLKRVLPNLCLLAICEIEEFAIENILAKMENGLMEAAPIWSDCKTFPREPFKNRVDLFIASYPCQPFSSAGKRQGADDPRHLWPYVRRFVWDVRPRLCFFENVDGHVSMGLSTVISDLEEDGYKTAWGIFSASEVGAPHQRKRVFILAYRNDAIGWIKDTFGQRGLRQSECLEVEETFSGIRLSHYSERSGMEKHLSAPSYTRLPGGHGSGSHKPRQIRQQEAKPKNSQSLGECPQPKNEGESVGTCGSERSEGSWSMESSDIQSRKVPLSGNLPDKNGGDSSVQQSDRSDVHRDNSDSENVAYDQRQRVEELGRWISGESKLNPAGDNGCDVWPSRPGEPQHGWEPPRVVADCNSITRGKHSEGRECDTETRSTSEKLGDSEATNGRRGIENNSRIRESCSTGFEDSSEVMVNAGCLGSQECEKQTTGIEQSGEREIESPMGRDTYGNPDRMDDAELYVSTDNRTDELRLLGNGVVPATAEKAFRVLMKEILNAK